MSTTTLRHAHDWRSTSLHDTGLGYFELANEDVGAVPVRLFMTAALIDELEDAIYSQVVNATRFPGTRLVCLTPDAHVGYGVPVGCVILTDADTGAIAMGPVGYDIGCGMVSARSTVDAASATPRRRLAFNRLVLERIAMGAGNSSDFATMSPREFQRVIREGAIFYASRFGARVDHSRAERQNLPVDDTWDIPRGGRGRPERGIPQLGSLGSGNHFIELQRCIETDTLFVQVHTGSRGFGHGLATNYFDVAQTANPAITHLDLGYFTPEDRDYSAYLNAVAAGANFAMVNRLRIFEEVADAFHSVFGGDLALVYEISHNLVQREWHPDFGWVNVHRKGATRALPAGHPHLDGSPWQDEGHPVLIPGSNMDYSYILRPRDSAKSGYSVNHGAGRRLSRGAARRELSQEEINRHYRDAGILVNTDGMVPLDEAGPAYKSSQEVVRAVTGAALADIEYTLWPLASLKAAT